MRLRGSAAATSAAHRADAVLPSFATPNDPLDVTGYVLLDRELMGNVLRIEALGALVTWADD